MKKLLKYTSRVLCVSFFACALILALLSLLRLMAVTSVPALRLLAAVLFLLVIILVITGAISLIRELISRIRFTRKHAAECNSNCFSCPFYIFCAADNEESSAQADAALK